MSAAPNTFQCHNIYVDRAMELLTDAEFRILIYATRHIMGWQDTIKTRRNEISVTMFEKGFITSKGKKFGGCGLSRTTIIRTLKNLSKYGFLEPVGDAGNDGQRWELHEGGIDWKALEDRKGKKDVASKKQTAKAAKASKEKRKRTGTSNVPPAESSTSNVPLGSTSNVPESPKSSTSNVLNQTHASKPNNKPIDYARQFFVPALLDAVTKQTAKITPLDPDPATYDEWMIFLNREFKIGTTARTAGFIYNMFKNRAAQKGYKEFNIAPLAELSEVQLWVAYEKRNAKDGKFLIRKPETINAKFLYWREKRQAVDDEKQYRAELESA